MAAGDAVPPGTVVARPLCVECRRCGRKAAFGALSPESRGTEQEVLARLVCAGCGSRSVKTLRLSDDREAARWIADR